MKKLCPNVRTKHLVYIKMCLKCYLKIKKEEIACFFFSRKEEIAICIDGQEYDRCRVVNKLYCNSGALACRI